MNAKFYQVGGSVRDELLGIASKDIDYAVETESFDAMRAAILERGGTIFLETPQYFTIRAKVPELGATDYVLCRKDGQYTDGRRPESVTVGTIFDDLARRDFTINAIAKAEDGTILDPFNGRADIENRIIHTVGKASERFNEDRLRILRAIRFAITKGFFLSEEVREYLRMDIGLDTFRGVSVERVREELFKAFETNTLATIRLLNEYSYVRDVIFLTYPNLYLKPTIQ